jgi:C4-dicarboxylate-specific signal transduction histidine kinase
MPSNGEDQAQCDSMSLGRQPYCNLVEPNTGRTISRAERARAIVDHVRIFGRPADEERNRVDPRKVVQAGLDLMGHQLRLRNIEVEADIPKSCLAILGDEVQLEQVMVSLLANARDAIDGRFAREAKDGSAARSINIKIACSEAERLSRISVRDTGGGMLDRIFEPFVTTREEGKGAGPSLAVSYGIIAGMGGMVEARNVDGGAEFTITLPAAEPVEWLSGEGGDQQACP